MGILKDIQEIGAVNRRADNVERRVLKTTEEVGELAEAILSVTSKSNAKGKKWMDIVDEACDVAIMGIDIAMTPPPGAEGVSDEAWREIVKNIFALKLKKWQTQVKSGRTLIPIGVLPAIPAEDSATKEYVAAQHQSPPQFEDDELGGLSAKEKLRIWEVNREINQPQEGCGQTIGHGVICGQGMLCINCAPELHKTSE